MSQKTSAFSKFGCKNEGFVTAMVLRGAELHRSALDSLVLIICDVAFVLRVETASSCLRTRWSSMTAPSFLTATLSWPARAIATAFHSSRKTILRFAALG